MFSSPVLSPRPSRWRHVLATGLTLALCAASAHAQTTAPGRVRLPNSVRPVTAVGAPVQAAAAATVRDTLTAAEAAAPMHVHLPLRLRNAAELERRVTANEIISREEMAARFLPEEKDYQAVAAWLTAQGLAVRSAGASHTAVLATGTPTQLEKAFETHFARVQFHGEERTSATVAPSLPAEIQSRVLGVHGLQPHLHPRKMSVAVPDATTHNGYPPFYIGDVLNVYDVPASGLNGNDQAIGIIIDSFPAQSDLTAFWKKNGVSQSLGNITFVDVDNDSSNDVEGEATLDTEWSSGIASGARVVVYATGDLAYIEDAYPALIDDLQSGLRPHLHQISQSFGAGEASDETPDDLAAFHAYFTSISAYGVTIFASSGDEGAYGTYEEMVEANYPATDPLCTAVGATALVLTANDVVLDEQGWSVEGRTEDYGDDSSGGGISVVFARPDYQVGLGVDLTAMRQVPDVAILGDPHTPGYVYLEGQPTAFGGTSLSCPIWAGLCALINQARENQGLPPLGRLNRLLYPLAGSPDIHDILRGTDGVYNCTKGYDLVTGIGSPDFNRLYKDLLAVPAPSAFFAGATPLSKGVYYLAFPSSNYFGYYSYLTDPHYIYHFDLGYEYIFDAGDENAGVYLYDFASGDFFYTSPTYPFPYLYDFNLGAILYYYPDTNRSGHYTTGPRYFYNTGTQQIITR